MKKYLSSTPDTMGGDWVIKGTRIPIDVILYRLRDGLSFEEIHRMYPTPSMKTLKGAISEAIDMISSINDQKTL